MPFFFCCQCGSSCNTIKICLNCHNNYCCDACFVFITRTDAICPLCAKSIHKKQGQTIPSNINAIKAIKDTYTIAKITRKKVSQQKKLSIHTAVAKTIKDMPLHTKIIMTGFRLCHGQTPMTRAIIKELQAKASNTSKELQAKASNTSSQLKGSK